MRNRVTRVMSHPVPRNRVIGSGTRVFLLYFICVGPLCDFKKRACKIGGALARPQFVDEARFCITNHENMCI